MHQALLFEAALREIRDSPRAHHGVSPIDGTSAATVNWLWFDILRGTSSHHVESTLDTERCAASLSRMPSHRPARRRGSERQFGAMVHLRALWMVVHRTTASVTTSRCHVRPSVRSCALFCGTRTSRREPVLTRDEPMSPSCPSASRHMRRDEAAPRGPFREPDLRNHARLHPCKRSHVLRGDALAPASGRVREIGKRAGLRGQRCQREKQFPSRAPPSTRPAPSPPPAAVVHRNSPRPAHRRSGRPPGSRR